MDINVAFKIFLVLILIWMVVMIIDDIVNRNVFKFDDDDNYINYDNHKRRRR